MSPYLQTTVTIFESKIKTETTVKQIYSSRSHLPAKHEYKYLFYVRVTVIIPLPETPTSLRGENEAKSLQQNFFVRIE